jgi:hypothetical protein
MTRSLELLDQILEMAKAQAKELDDYNILRHKALRTLGENAVVYHLGVLKELITKESSGELPDPTVNLGGKILQVSFGDEPTPPAASAAA